MSRVEATALPAQVVEFEAVGNRPDHALVDGLVTGHTDSIDKDLSRVAVLAERARVEPAPALRDFDEVEHPVGGMNVGWSALNLRALRHWHVPDYT
jgi:hypothetical protein